MEKTDVLIVGGGAAGLVAAITGKSHYPDKDFLLIRKEKQVLVPCGIPYIFGSLENSDQNILPDTMLINAGVPIRVGEVLSVDPEEKVCVLADGTMIGFEKLILALGSTPVVPQWLKGRNLENVFTIPKDKEYLDHMLEKLRGHNDIVTIGGGFIGVEVSSELNKKDKNVTIVEILPNIMSLVFDTELSVKAEDILQKSGVTIKTGIGAQEIVGNGKVSGVLLSNGAELAADAVVLSVGYHPNTNIAEKAGLNINENGFIVVDEYMRTENPDIFAVGDCAEKRDFFTRKLTAVMLASTACAEARIASMNLYKLSTLKTFNGTLAIFSTDIDGVGFGAAGLSESQAKHEGFDIVVGRFEGLDKHPGTLANTHKQLVKLIASRDGGVIIGGEVIGGPSVGELTNLIGCIIENRMTINSILTSQIGTHPLLTASPAGYPLIKAAEIAAINTL
jgi:NADH oxidase (H2O2-forming)